MAGAPLRSVKYLMAFVLLGIATAAPGEYVVHILVGNSVPSYLTTLFLNYPILLLVIYGVTRGIDAAIRRRWLATLLVFVAVGFLGLMFEWFVLGNSPWVNPAADQFGMVSFWASLALAPRLLLDPSPRLMRLKRMFVAAFAVYAGLVASLTLVPGEDLQLVLGVLAISAAQRVLDVLFAAQAVIAWRSSRAAQIVKEGAVASPLP